jgi:AraC-like DNA-binding protein
MSKTPERLLNEDFFREDVPIQLFQDVIKERFELHWHEFYELTYIISGSGVNEVNGHPYPLETGDLFLLTPADFHQITPDPGENLELYNLIFSPLLLSDELFELLFSEAGDFMTSISNPEKDVQIRRIFERIREEKQQRLPGREIALRGEMERLLLEWHRGRNREGNQPSPGLDGKGYKTGVHPGIQKALIFIQHGFRQPLTLEEAATQACLSPTYFSELFRKSIGCTFQQYVLQLRLAFAYKLLRSSQCSVTEVCHASGFNTLTYFERVFRAQYQMSPRHAQKRG